MTTPGDHALYPTPRPLTRRGWGILAGVIVLALATLGVILYVYDAEGGSTVNGGLQNRAGNGLIITVDPHAVDPRLDQATVHLDLDYQGDDLVSATDSRLLANTRIVVLTSRGLQEFKLLAGATLSQADIVMGIDGEEALYPFDEHLGEMSIRADTYEVGSDGIVTSTGIVPIGIRGAGAVNGWNTTMDLPSGMTPTPQFTFTFQRAFSTQIFAVLLVSLSVLIGLCALVAGVLVSTNRRRLEVTMLSWAAALLFALPLLRNYLPNAPPIGASLDIYVYLWVIVAAVVGLVMLVVAWIRQKRAELLHEGSLRESASPSDASAR